MMSELGGSAAVLCAAVITCDTIHLLFSFFFYSHIQAITWGHLFHYLHSFKKRNIQSRTPNFSPSPSGMLDSDAFMGRCTYRSYTMLEKTHILLQTQLKNTQTSLCPKANWIMHSIMHFLRLKYSHCKHIDYDSNGDHIKCHLILTSTNQCGRYKMNWSLLCLIY